MTNIATLRVRDQTGLLTARPTCWSPGVPLPCKGFVRDPANLVLRTSAGKPLRMQVDPLARWADGSLKWVLLTVPGLRLANGKSATLRLGLGRSRSGTGKHAIHLRQDADTLHVQTPTLRFTIAKSGPLIPLIERLVGKTWQPRAAGLDPEHHR